ncbi:hypothetical protein GMB86_08025 [Terrilactibacillus sp. BCM23-1]|uniref:DUF1453 family protein n=1 Tax=Terrilactibacillus tamarindi TaxID=2599694 RepID=A0A6N8CUU7_9BACI|nr:hypothetical protein [Terrilactibacillus tamarindi]MTT31956.1 hypothetical protein [Terrilactibacillus tamarindi]
MYILIGSIILVSLIINQLKERPLTAKLYRLPLLLLFTACYSVTQMPFIKFGDLCILSLSLFLSFGFGMLQGRYTPLINHEGAWYIAGSVISLCVWFISVPIRYLLKYIFISLFHLTLHLDGPSSYVIYLFSIAGILLGRYTMLWLRHPSLVKNVAQNEQKLKRIRGVR